MLVDVNEFRNVLDLDADLVGDDELITVAMAVESALLPLLTDELHDTHANCTEAALGMAVQVWQSRHAPGGQMTGSDLNPFVTPHLLGPGLISRFTGLLGPCLPYGGAVIA
jgi:hypothetical protein